MTRKGIQSLAAVFFLAAALLSLFHFELKPEKPKAEVTFAQAEQVIKKAGFTISKNQPAGEREPQPKKAVQPARQKEENAVKTYILHVKSGMTAPEIGKVLLKEGIIKDPKEFERYLAEQGLNGQIQLGEFVLTSNMSISQICRTLTK
ncbi:hypothetical protein V1498_06545 [Peribacillus sp. SCS-26]|uniref:hypothetical protein n=1 Tax=Paraperibacillus marinus TaxID=3115295 RepID=UPI00390638E8